MPLRYPLVALLIAGALATGWQRRRPHWTARSWRCFAVVMVSLFASAAVAVGMGFGVDRGVWDRLNDVGDIAYGGVMAALLLIPSFAIPILLVWFAVAEPDEQFGWGRERVSSASPAAGGQGPAEAEVG